MENLAGLPEVKSLMPEWSTAAESVMSRRVMGAVSCLDSSEPAECQSYKAENCTNVTVSVHKKHMQVVNSCRAQEEIYMGQIAVPATMNKSGLQIDAGELSQDTQAPCTVFVWFDGAWSGEPVSCKSLFADAGRLKNHAIDAPRVSRWETSDYPWKQDRDINGNSGTCRVSVSEAARYVKDTTEQVIPVTDEVLDATDTLHNVFERVNKSGEQFFGVHDVLEAAIARGEGRLAEEAEGRELPERPLLEQTTIECAREKSSDLGTKNDPRSDIVSKLGIVAVISRFAVLWMTRAKWNCLDDICKLTRAEWWERLDQPLHS